MMGSYAAYVVNERDAYKRDYQRTRKLYEELRAAIDDGHESMTHDDALEWVRESHEMRHRLGGLEK